MTGLPETDAPVRGRALVLYCSRFGNTRRVAAALARGLRQNLQLDVDCLSTEELPPEQLEGYDFVAVGGPTEMFSASRSMKDYLDQIPPALLRGKRGFAFDTKLAGVMSGSAARIIQRRLERMGVEIVHPHVSAIVRTMNRDERAMYGQIGAPDWARRMDPQHPKARPSEPVHLDLLDPAAEAEFEALGRSLSSLVVARGPPLLA